MATFGLTWSLNKKIAKDSATFQMLSGLKPTQFSALLEALEKQQ